MFVFGNGVGIPLVCACVCVCVCAQIEGGGRESLLDVEVQGGIRLKAKKK